MADSHQINASFLINKQIKKTKYFLFKRELFYGLVRLVFFGLPLIIFFFLLDIAFEFNIQIRIVFLILSIFIICRLLYLNVLKVLLRFIGVIDGYDNFSIAKKLIGDNEINDRLLIYLELQQFDKANELILKALNQKEQEVVKFNFKSKVFLYKPKVWHYIIAFSFIVLISISLSISNTFQKAAVRFFYPTFKLSYKTLNFSILNDSLVVNQNDNFELFFKVKGTYQPSRIYVRISDLDFLANKFSDSVWSFTFTNLNQTIRFFIHDHLNQSNVNTLFVNELPILLNISIQIVPPQHTHIEPYIITGSGNFNFPEGSSITWTLQTLYSEKVLFDINGTNHVAQKTNNQFATSIESQIDLNYNILLSNNKTQSKDNLNFTATVIKDEYPTIEVEIMEAPSLFEPLTISGLISDDYGFSDFQIVHKVNDSLYSVPIEFNKNSLKQDFYFKHNIFDFARFIVSNDIEYYLKVTDNDKINGFKSSLSAKYHFHIPDSTQIDRKFDDVSRHLVDKLALGIQMVKELNIQQNSIEKRLKSENLNQWEKTQLSEMITQNKADINKLLNEIQSMNNQLKNFTSFLNKEKQNNNILQKQLMIQELMDKLMDNELSEMFQEIDKLKSEIKDNNKDAADKPMSLKSLEEMMNRNLEILKRFEVEKGMNDLVDELNKKADELSSANSEEERERIEHNIDSLFDNHEELLKLNSQLQTPIKLDSFDNEKEDVKQRLSSNDNSLNSKENNEDNSSSVKRLSESIKSNLESSAGNQNAEDIENLKQIRSNLLQLSFIQEDLIESMKSSNSKLPEYNEQILKQNEIIKAWDYIDDSLNALIVRNPKLGNLLNSDLLGIESMNRIITDNIFSEYPKSIFIQQSKVLAHYNNILLYIDESIQESDDNMSGQGQGGACKKPGRKKSTSGDMAKTQQGLKQQLKDIINKLKQAGNQNHLGDQLSMQMTKYLSYQEQMQKMINDYLSQNNLGHATRQIFNEVNKLIDENIKDILNKNVSNQTMFRQEKIVTKLLESDKAEHERKIEERRESRENSLEFFNNHNVSLRDTLKINSFDELIKFRLLKLNKYYLDLYHYYIDNSRKFLED